MKLFSFFIAFIWGTYIFGQVQFTTPIPVADGATYGYLRPKIALDANNEPVILWGKSSTHQIFVSTFNGSGFNTPVQINPVNTHPYISSWYNADIKNSGDTLVAVFPTDMPANRVFLVKSTDGGNTWSDSIRVDNIPPGGIAYFPSVDINEFGQVAITFMKHEAGWLNPRYVVTTSLDGGSSFSPDTNASAVAIGEVCDCCPAHMIFENDRQVLLFRNNNSNTREFYASVSIDNGNSFMGMNIDNQGWIYPACPSVAPSAFIDNDSLIAVFMSGASGNNRIYVSTSDINGLQNGFVQMVDDVVPANTIQNYPKIAGEDSIMAMVWYNTMPGEADIYFRFSNTGAVGLMGDGLNISNPTTGTQQNPDIVYANGIFHIVYQNNATQELYYLRAILDEYIGLNEPLEEPIQWYIQNDQLTIIFNKEGKHGLIEMLDARGAVIMTRNEDLSNTVTLDVQHLSHGVYWVRAEGGRPIKFYR